MEPLRKELAEGVFLTYVPAAKFKTGVLGAQLITPLEESTVAAGALLPAVLAAAAVVFLLSARGLPARDAVTADFGGIFRFDGQLTLTAAVLGGFLLLAADRYGHGNKTEKAMTLSDALVIGFAQMIAVVPGLSRSGTTISAGMLRGFDRTFAVKFSFFLSIPAVLGANLLSLIKAISAGINWAEVPMYLCGVAAALVSGYLAIFALNRIAQRGKFGGFCYYCWGAGLLTLILSLIS